MADSQDSTGQSQHAEGIQHIASNTAPPGTQDTSRGTEGGVGTGAQSAVSSSQDFKSPLVPGSGSSSEQTSSQGGVIDTVKSYLGYGGAAGTGASETGQLGTSGETRNAADTTSTSETTGTGSGSGITGAAATAASAVGLGSGNSAAGGGLGSTSSSSGAADGTTGSSSTTGGSTLETAKEKVQEVTNTAGSKDDSTSGTDDHKPPQPAGGKPGRLENESAIPTAGGERLGEKHWGESKIVPENPEARASAAGISSEEGQPTQQTTDNTNANTGGATGPPGSSSTGDSSKDSSEGKTSTVDKIKDKLHIGKSE